MRKDLHEKPFDDGTITKLEIFERYAERWIPTFIMSGHKNIYIFDFFAGTGYDLNNVSGSSIRILKQLERFAHDIIEKNSKIHLYLNEYDGEKFQKLKDSCQAYIANSEILEQIVKVYYFNEDFSKLFKIVLPKIEKYPSLVYLDQNGIKFSSDDYFLEIVRLEQVDFLYYISSSYIWRFGDTEEFKKSVPFDIEKIKSNQYKDIHRSVLEQLRNKLPKDTKISLYPFTIKKDSGIYGIVFGTSHILAADKFLSIVWKENPINGEANFDIDDDNSKNQLDLFDSGKLKKVEKFKLSLRKEILNKNIRTNQEAYDYTLGQGHISSHARDEVSLMKKEKLIYYQGKSPLINYEKVYKEKRIISYEVLP